MEESNGGVDDSESEYCVEKLGRIQFNLKYDFQVCYAAVSQLYSIRSSMESVEQLETDNTLLCDGTTETATGIAMHVVLLKIF